MKRYGVMIAAFLFTISSIAAGPSKLNDEDAEILKDLEFYSSIELVSNLDVVGSVPAKKIEVSDENKKK